MKTSNNSKRLEEALVDILTEKHRRSFILKDLMDRIIEISKALKEFMEEVPGIKTTGKMIFMRK